MNQLHNENPLIDVKKKNYRDCRVVHIKVIEEHSLTVPKNQMHDCTGKSRLCTKKKREILDKRSLGWISGKNAQKSGVFCVFGEG